VPQALFPTGTLAQVSGSHGYAVTKDGKRFLVLTRPPQSSPPLTVVVNWPASLKQ
jgi:hypothetical protein